MEIVDFGKFGTESHLVCIKKFSKSFSIVSLGVSNREEKSLRHVAMVAKFLDDNKPIKSLKSLFALFQTSPILFNFI